VLHVKTIRQADVINSETRGRVGAAPSREKQKRSHKPAQARLPTYGFSGETVSAGAPGKRKPRFAGLSWAGQDSNLRSSDYELRVRYGALVG
jgi:hypothetical protein